jgi:osmotically-inducible protein OsmY
LPGPFSPRTAEASQSKRGDAAVSAEIRESIEQALKRSAELEAARLSIETEGGEVTLRGRLGSWHERDVAQRAAWSVPGVTRVDDLTMIEA